MKKKYFQFFLLIPIIICAQSNTLIVYSDSGRHVISRHIYGQFSEHLGTGIYGGIWVGKDSKIPNTRGIRNDVVEALKRLNVPNLRWPGGCFADEYHWQDGIGPANSRPKMVNTNWGGVVEDNSFGVHEFMDLCQQLNTEPYITGNVGSGTVEEMSNWVEYLNFDGESPMTQLRKANGQDSPWKVKYWGVGNESWGCGGNMRPEYYADLYNRFATFCKNYGDNKLYKIAGGSYQNDYNWTEVIMKNVKHNLMKGISMHYYTINRDWDDKASATVFDEKSYFEVLEKALKLDEYITGHSAVMDKYDPDKKIDLIIDEWGTWHAQEPGTKPGFLYQQNTLRDAFVAALSLNIFHKHKRVHMANIAQTINVLQAMILTDHEKMILTPTYHVFDLYKYHQDAIFLPVNLESEDYTVDKKTMKSLYATASRSKDGILNINLSNVNSKKNINLDCEIKGAKIYKINGRILSGELINSHNTFENQQNVVTSAFDDFSKKGNSLAINIPAKSIILLRVETKN